MYDITATVTPAAILVLLFISSTSASIWSFDPDYGPAPSPEDGPPLSANASRNPDLLKYQIPGIVLGYFGFVLVVGVFALTYGRRLRRAAQASSNSTAREMVKPTNRALEISPNSQAWSPQGWGSPRNIMQKFKRKSDTAVSESSIPQSPPAFDAQVVEQDKRNRQIEMERLYAAVVTAEESYSGNPEPSSHVRKISASSFSQPHPPRRSVAEPPPSASFNPASASAPRKDIRAIYPNDEAPPLPPTPRGYMHPPQSSASRTQSTMPYSPTGPVSPTSSTASKQNRQSRSSRKTYRGLNISAPIQRYPASNDSQDDIDATTPLSPRTYDPGPPPPTPPARLGGYDYEEGNESDIVDDYDTEDINEPRPPPHPAPQRSFSYKSDASTLHGNGEQASSRYNHSTKDLPLRGLTNNSYLTPATPRMQTTVIEQRQHYQPHGPPNGMWSAVSMPNGMWSAGLGAPRTAGIMSPHSPYMPFSPVTPVTPHLQTKRERKQSRKEALRKAVTQDGMVKDEKEMWGDPY